MKKTIQVIVDPEHEQFNSLLNRYKTKIYLEELDNDPSGIFVELLDEIERLYSRNDYLEALCEARGIPKGEYMGGPNPLQQDTDI